MMVSSIFVIRCAGISAQRGVIDRVIASAPQGCLHTGAVTDRTEKRDDIDFDYSGGLKSLYTNHRVNECSE